MSDKKQSRRSARDRRPNEVPHHPKLMTTAIVIAAVAFVVMSVWFWAVISGQASLFTSGQDVSPTTDTSVVQPDNYTFPA